MTGSVDFHTNIRLTNMTQYDFYWYQHDWLNLLESYVIVKMCYVAILVGGLTYNFYFLS